MKALVIFCLLSIILCQGIIFYTSPSGGIENSDGLTPETAFKWNWNSISTTIRKKYADYKDITIMFLEGDYYVDEYGISVSAMSSRMYFRFWPVPGAKVRIIGGIKLPKLEYHPKNSRIWVTHLDINGNYPLFINNRRVIMARSPKSWDYARLWNYYATEDENDSSYVNRHYVVSEALIKILSKLSKDELNKARIICKHYYHTETDYIIDIDPIKNEIITNVTKEKEDYIKALPIEPDSLYYVENVFNFLSEPNEYYLCPNGTLYYYSDKNDDISKAEAFISTTGYFGFHSNKHNKDLKGNFEVRDIEILATSNYGVYLSNSENITLVNLTIHNSGGGISVQACKNITINHTYIYDVQKYGQYIAKSDYVISHNNIIRDFEENHGIEVSDGNNTVVTNNEIASGYTAAIMVKAHSAYDMNNIRKILVKDNHCHHVGYGIANDLGGIQVLQATNGLIIDHNHFHDIWGESYAIHGIYLGTGTAGTICKNNLVHDTNTSTFKIDLGMEITLENNIWAYGGGSLLFWSTNIPQYHEFNIHHNIFLCTDSKLMGGGGWNAEPTNMTIDENIYWDVKNGAENFLFRYKNKTQWSALGYDKNSIIADPMFTNYEKRDFTLKDKTNAKKIGFTEFDFKFGVTGEDYWLELANGKKNNIFHANQILPPTYFFTSGFTDFDSKYDSFWDNCTMNPHDSIIEKTTILSYSGINSLRFAASAKQKHSNTRPEFIIPCNYEQGHGTFSFYFYVTNIKNHFSINFDSYLGISIANGNILNGQFTYEAHTWNKITIYINYGDYKTKSIYEIEVNGIKKEGSEINYKKLSNFKIVMIQTFDDTYIDDLTAKTNYEIPKYFRFAYNENADIFNYEVDEELFLDEETRKKMREIRESYYNDDENETSDSSQSDNEAQNEDYSNSGNIIKYFKNLLFVIILLF